MRVRDGISPRWVDAFTQDAAAVPGAGGADVVLDAPAASHCGAITVAACRHADALLAALEPEAEPGAPLTAEAAAIFGSVLRSLLVVWHG